MRSAWYVLFGFIVAAALVVVAYALAAYGPTAPAPEEPAPSTPGSEVGAEPPPDNSTLELHRSFNGDAGPSSAPHR